MKEEERTALWDMMSVARDWAKELTGKVGALENRIEELEDTKLRNAPVVIADQLFYHGHKDDAGFDLVSIDDVAIPAKEYAPMIHTGAHVAIPEGYFGLIKERSGMAAKGIFVMGGVIDSGYRGEIMVNLANISGYDYVIKSGDRIAQLIILPCSAVMALGDLLPSDRGEKGFGSTGK